MFLIVPFFNYRCDSHLMQKGPLVYAAVFLAALLIAMSFVMLAFPDSAETIGIVASGIAVVAVAVLLAILFKTRRGQL